jgi:MraZ protein
MLIGHYNHTLDTKKRVSVPAKWRSDFTGDTVVITTGLDASLFIFGLENWKKIAEKIVAHGFLDTDSRQFSRFMLANAFEVAIDSHGRILIPDDLVSFAKLTTDVTLAGSYDRAEIWDAAVYEKMMSEVSHNAMDVAERISKVAAA